MWKNNGGYGLCTLQSSRYQTKNSGGWKNKNADLDYYEGLLQQSMDKAILGPNPSEKVFPSAKAP